MQLLYTDVFGMQMEAQLELQKKHLAAPTALAWPADTQNAPSTGMIGERTRFQKGII